MLKMYKHALHSLRQSLPRYERKNLSLYLPNFCSIKIQEDQSNPENQSSKINDELKQVLQKFRNFGFSQKQTLAMLENHPAVSKCPVNKISVTIDTLNAIGFKTAEVNGLIASEPKLLGQSPRILKKCFSNLLNELGDQAGRTAAMTTPSALMINEILTNEKIDYVLQEMGLKKIVVAKSKILDLSLDFIKIRHEFAARSGFYKRPNPKKEEEDNNNPSLSNLFFTSDQKFVAQFKGLAPEEFTVFEAMMHAESAAEQEELEEGDEYGSDEEHDEPRDKSGKKWNSYNIRFK